MENKKIKEELGIIDEGKIVNDEDLEGNEEEEEDEEDEE